MKKGLQIFKFKMMPVMVIGIFSLISINSYADVCDEEKIFEDRAKTYDEYLKNTSLDEGTRLLYTQRRDEAQDRLASASGDCRTLKAKRNAASQEKLKCESPERKKLGYRWVGDDVDGSCEPAAENVREVEDNGECNYAQIFEGGRLKGQNCKKAENTINSVTANNQALTTTTTSMATAYSQVQAMQATGNQDDAQKRQKNVLMGLAVSKIALGAAQGAAAVQLKAAASGASSAQSGISGAQSQLRNFCNSQTLLDMESCFYANAEKYGVAPDKAAYASFERMSLAADQSEAQATKANDLAKTNMISGLADTFVGLQALKMARQAQKNAQNMAPPVVNLGQNGSGFSVAPGIGAPGNSGDTGGGGGDGAVASFGDSAPAPIQGGMIVGKSFGNNAFVSGKTTVSAGGGSGGGGGGGGGGARPNEKPRGRTSMNTVGGEYTGGGGGGGSGGGGKGGKDAADPTANPLADMLAKMFPADESGKPVIDTRMPASNGMAGNGNQDPQAMSVYASELSIFEQISSKIRSLASKGQI